AWALAVASLRAGALLAAFESLYPEALACAPACVPPLSAREFPNPLSVATLLFASSYATGHESGVRVV
ncbi:hypothetical protein, partial [Microbacterium enclense]